MPEKIRTLKQAGCNQKRSILTLDSDKFTKTHLKLHDVNRTFRLSTSVIVNARNKSQQTKSLTIAAHL